MSRVRHIHADPDEHIFVHRDHPPTGDDHGCGCLILLLILGWLFPSLGTYIWPLFVIILIIFLFSIFHN